MIGEIQLLVTFKEIQRLPKNSHYVNFLNVYFFSFSFFLTFLHHFYYFFVAYLQSSNLISSASVPMLASPYN